MAMVLKKKLCLRFLVFSPISLGPWNMSGSKNPMRIRNGRSGVCTFALSLLGPMGDIFNRQGVTFQLSSHGALAPSWHDIRYLALVKISSLLCWNLFIIHELVLPFLRNNILFYWLRKHLYSIYYMLASF